jgi:hypothetical protein
LHHRRANEIPLDAVVVARKIARLTPPQLSDNRKSFLRHGIALIVIRVSIEMLEQAIRAPRTRDEIHPPPPLAEGVEVRAYPSHVYGVQNRGVDGGDKRDVARHAKECRCQDGAHQPLFTLVRGLATLTAPTLYSPVVQGEQKVQPTGFTSGDEAAMNLEVKHIRD